MDKRILDKFFTEKSQGRCSDSRWEFGNLYKKDYKCAFNVGGECHFNGECSKLEETEHV